MTPTNRRPLIAAGIALGIGLGGFVDGIVFHQILQVHSMLSARYPKLGVDPSTAVVNYGINMFWDGLFHAFDWSLTAIGVGLLWSAARRPDVLLSTRTLVGAMVVGWGVFNLVEGLIDHQLLGIHHVVEAGDHLLWDLLFLASGAALGLAGWAVIRSGRNEAESWQRR